MLTFSARDPGGDGMARRLQRNLVVLGLGSVAAIVIGVASAQDRDAGEPARQADQPAQLDRSFGGDGGMMVGGDAGSMQDRGTGGSGMMTGDGGTMMGGDAGSGGA